jgi:hypothetical protein
MQLNLPSERDTGITNVSNARYTIEEYARAIKKHKK